MAKKFMVIEHNGYTWDAIGSSDSLSVARSAYNKRRRTSDIPLALVKVVETNTNTDAEFGDDITEQRDLEYDI